MVQLGLTLEGIATALDLEEALSLLQKNRKHRLGGGSGDRPSIRRG
jgi:hypothetical protein